MEAAFDLLQPPELTELPPFRFAYRRIRGPYVPWARVSTLDTVAEALEMAGVDRVGPAFGLYHDLPFSQRETDAWIADLGYPVEPGAALPVRPDLRAVDLPPTTVVALRYRGDLGSFPPALQLLVDWALQRGHDLRGPLLERFHVSDALTGVEERDVYVALEPLPSLAFPSSPSYLP